MIGEMCTSLDSYTARFCLMKNGKGVRMAFEIDTQPQSKVLQLPRTNTVIYCTSNHGSRSTLHLLHRVKTL